MSSYDKWSEKGKPVWKLCYNATWASAVLANHDGLDPRKTGPLLLSFLQQKSFTCKYFKLKDNHAGLPCAAVHIYNLNDDEAFDAAYAAVDLFNKTCVQAPAAATPSPAAGTPKPRAAATSALSAGAAAFVPTATATAPVNTTQKSFAAAATKSATAPPVPTGGVATATPVAQPTENAHQRSMRLKKEREELKKQQEELLKKEQELAAQISSVDDAVKKENQAVITSMLKAAEERGIIGDLLSQLEKAKPAEPATLAAAAAASTDAVTTDKATTKSAWGDEPEDE